MRQGPEAGVAVSRFSAPFRRFGPKKAPLATLLLRLLIGLVTIRVMTLCVQKTICMCCGTMCPILASSGAGRLTS